MQVILLQDIKGIGRKGDVKELKDGYVRNFLLPQNLVAPATASALKQLEEKKKKEAEEKNRLITSLEEKAEKIQGLEIKFKARIGEKGEMFGSVTSRDISQILAENGFLGVEVELKKPIKELGETKVLLDLGEGVKTEVKVVVEAI